MSHVPRSWIPPLVLLLGACGLDAATGPVTPGLTQAPPGGSEPAAQQQCLDLHVDLGACTSADALGPAGVRTCWGREVEANGYHLLESAIPGGGCAGDMFRSASFRCCAPPPPPVAGCTFLPLVRAGDDPPAPRGCLTRDTWDDLMKHTCQLQGASAAQIMYKGACGVDRYLWAYAYCCG